MQTTSSEDISVTKNSDEYRIYSSSIHPQFDHKNCFILKPLVHELILTEHRSLNSPRTPGERHF